MNYSDFLKSKAVKHKHKGIKINADELNPALFDFQKFIVTTALKAGKYAIFADCGLGKTLMQLEWARMIHSKTKGKVLILAPLAVRGQTLQEAEKFRINLEGIYITNYEQLDNINPKDYKGIVLDESSILKNYEGAIKTKIIESFSDAPYKLACTATPSPNDPMELGNHAEFLDVMSRSQMLSMYFVHDGGETQKWRLKGHAVELFYRWVGQWALMINKPADIGFCQAGFDLPKLNLIEKQITTKGRDNGTLFNSIAISATNFNEELRLTKTDRLNLTAEIVNSSDENFIIWIKQNEEGEYLKKLIPDAKEVKGSDSPEYKEQTLLDFAQDKFRVLITKTKIAQFGLNYQNCHNQIFASLDFSFESLYQGIRRSYRFGQSREVNIYLITTDTMQNVIESINRKQEQFITMQKEMEKTMNAHFEAEKVKHNLTTDNRQSDWFNISRGDCIKLIENLPEESIGFSVFSPPFAELYTYSAHLEDLGNSKDYNEFLTQFSFLTKQLYRVLKQGRNIAVHCMDLPIQKGKEGFIGLRDFSGMLLKSFEDVGFIYHSRITIWKDPATEMQRTKALGLLHKQLKKDSTMSRVGIPDYILVFRKDGERNNPVTQDDIPVDLWRKYASPVWFDIDYGNTLQGYRDAREEEDEKHICPLQLDTIDRLIHLYSNKGDVVLSPFMGIGSEGFQAIKRDRKFIGFELKESYFETAHKNLIRAELEKQQTTLL